MSKGEYSKETMGPLATNRGLHDVIPTAEAKGDQDENDLAAFGKRPQLKVRLPSFVPRRPGF